MSAVFPTAPGIMPGAVVSGVRLALPILPRLGMINGVAAPPIMTGLPGSFSQQSVYGGPRSAMSEINQPRANLSETLFKPRFKHR
ncbi:hypothetical protein ACONQD_003562, partial [Edwardsiella ictaluri]